MGEGEGNSRELDQTPTWAVAAVCAVIILISIILEKVLHLVGEVMRKFKKQLCFWFSQFTLAYLNFPFPILQVFIYLFSWNENVERKNWIP